MVERIAILIFMVLFGATLAAMTPVNAAPASDAAGYLQDTPAPTVVGPTVGVTLAVVTSTPGGPVPVTGGGDPAMTTVIITGLLVILGIAILVGGVALMRRPH
jgi:hypothetical protein